VCGTAPGSPPAGRGGGHGGGEDRQMTQGILCAQAAMQALTDAAHGGDAAVDVVRELLALVRTESALWMLASPKSATKSVLVNAQPHRARRYVKVSFVQWLALTYQSAFFQKITPAFRKITRKGWEPLNRQCAARSS
jgi:hypothetical protein